MNTILLAVLLAPTAHAATLDQARDGVCTEQHYDVPSDRFTEQQLGWLKKILMFVHTPEKLPSVSYELSSNTPVSYDEFKELLGSKPFKKWAGPALNTACKDFLRAKLGMKDMAGEIRARKTDVKIADRYPAYKVAHEKLFQVLHDKFAVQTVDDESCDNE